MTREEFSQIGKILWGITDQFRGVTKLIAYGKRWACGCFATRRVANSIVAACKATTGKSSVVRVGWRV